MWKFDNKDELIKAIENKDAGVAKKAEEKRLREELAYKTKSTSGKDWFRVMESEKYKQFDEETGLPTHDKDGKPLSDAIKNGNKKLQKSKE